MRLEKICNFSMCTSCRGVRGSSPGKKIENQECRKSHIRSFCKAFKVSNLPELPCAYLQVFQRRKSPFIFFLLNVFEQKIEDILKVLNAYVDLRTSFEI